VGGVVLHFGSLKAFPLIAVCVLVLMFAAGATLLSLSLLPPRHLEGTITRREILNKNDPRRNKEFCKLTINGESVNAPPKICREISAQVSAEVSGGELWSITDEFGHTWSRPPGVRYLYGAMGIAIILGGAYLGLELYRASRRRRSQNPG